MSAANIIPFPFARRQKLIGNIVRRSLELDANAASKHISDQIDRQCAVLRRRGVVEEVIQREARSLAAAVSARVWRIVMDKVR